MHLNRPPSPILRGAHIDLNEAAVRAFPGLAQGLRSPLLDPTVCNAFVRAFHDAQGVRWSYGGYLEDRAALWRGSYLDREPGSPSIHVGIDVNLCAATPVSLQVPFQVLSIGDDHDSDGGWGPYVIGGLASEYGGGAVVVSHLADIRCATGDIVSALTPFAEVGSAPENGGWYDHYHIQRLSPESARLMERARFRIDEIDGYYPAGNIGALSRRFPNPLTLIPLTLLDTLVI